jgi:hypothetical protein
MTAQQQADVDAVIDRGMRQFYAPPILADGTSHIWSFMRPTMTIAVHAEYKGIGGASAGLVAVDSAPNGFANFGGSPSFPAWCVHGVLEYSIDNSLMTVSTSSPFDAKRIIHIFSIDDTDTLLLEDVVSSDEFTLSGASRVPFTITDSIFALPTSFGGIEGDLTLEAGSGYMPVRQVGDQQIREMFLNSAVQTGVPAYFCVRPWRNPGIDHRGNTGHIGQYTRYELVLFPRPDKTYNLSFRYLFIFPGVTDLVGSGSGVTELHPPGIAYHHEAMLASCLAVAEQYADSPNGEHRAYFEKRIAASVSLDRKMAGSAMIGHNSDRSDTLYSQGRAKLPNQITYNNVLY